MTHRQRLRFIFNTRTQTTTSTFTFSVADVFPRCSLSRKKLRFFSVFHKFHSDMMIAVRPVFSSMLVRSSTIIRYPDRNPAFIHLWTRLMWSQWLWGVQRPGLSHQQPNKKGQQEPLKCIEPLQNIICGIHFGNVHVQIMISVLLMKICLSLRLTYMYRNFSFGICSILVIISVQYPFLSCVNTVLHAVLRFTHS